MEYITTTNLRTQTPQLIKALKNGDSVNLVHRSKIVGILSPQKEETKIMTKKDIEHLKQLSKEMNLPQASYKERDRLYKKHLMEKYGKNLS